MDPDEATCGWLTMPLSGIFAFAGLYLLRRFMKGAQFTERVSAKEKVVLITGASAGIGKQTARELNLRGASVYMLCRNLEKAQLAMLELTKLGCNPTRLFVKHLDLADFSTVRRAANEIQKGYLPSEVPKVDILINNAGIMFYPKFELTVDGYEMTWQTNYLGHFLLTELMLPLLKKSPQGRIVNVSSALHKRADSVDPSVVNDKKRFNKSQPYNRSKLALVMHVCELTRRLRASDPQCAVTVNAVHPGVCYTELMRYTVFNMTPFRQIITPLLWFFMKTDKDGAQTSLYVALSKSVESISGKYFGECKQHHASPAALDNEACSVLYDQSIKAVGLLNGSSDRQDLTLFSPTVALHISVPPFST